MLKTINKKYLIFSVPLMLFFLKDVDTYYIPLYVINFVTIIIYFFVLNNQSEKNANYFTTKRLAVVVFIYSFLSVGIYNIMSFYYRGNFFVFSEMDAMFYDNESVKMAAMNFSDAILYYLRFMSIDDLGIVLIISSLYRIVESNLFVNLFYIIIGVFTALSIFRISKNIMSVKYSYLCALTYSISSFILWFNSSGLKESFMVMLIVFFFDQLYQFYKKRKIKSIIFSAISLLGLIFFRPIIIIFCLGSVGLGLLLSRKINTFSLFFSLLIFVTVLYSSNFFLGVSSRYMYSDTEQFNDLKEKTGMVKGGLLFTYITNIVAASIGPMPTILPNEKTMLSLFSPGLIYRVLMGIAFWFGIFYIIKTKQADIYPLVLFYLFEVVSLVYILESLELRKSLSHFPMIYIISFWFLDKYNKSDFRSYKIKNRIKTLINISCVIFFLLIIYWNFRN